MDQLVVATLERLAAAAERQALAVEKIALALERQAATCVSAVEPAGPPAFLLQCLQEQGLPPVQGRARQLYTAEKKTFEEIAQELDSDEATVKRWITGIKE